MAGRRTDEQARATRAAILHAAVDLASRQGFEGVTIGALAGDLGMSKAGVLGHFSTKEALQLAAYGHATAVFAEMVAVPARSEPAGLSRLRAVCAHWADFIESPPWSGGCVLTAASFEFDDRIGAVHDAMREGMLRWRALLAHQARVAIDAGELPPTASPEQLAFVIGALATGAVQARQMHRDPAAAQRFRDAAGAQLGGALDA